MAALSEFFRDYLIPFRVDVQIRKSLLFILLFAVASVLIFAHIWEPISDTDALVYWTVSKNAAEHGNWMPLHHSQLWWPEFHEHPPFFFWVQALWFKVAGSGLAQSKVLPGLLGLGLVLLIYRIGRRFGGAWVGFFAGVCLLASPRFTAMASKPRLDMPLVFFITLALWGLLNLQNRKLWPWLVVGFSTSAAIMTKGPVGAAPIAVLFIWILIFRKWEILADWRFYLALMISFLPFAVWLYGEGASAVSGYVHDQVYKTMTTGSTKIKPGPFFYPNILLAQYWHWLLFCAIGIWVSFRKKLELPQVSIFLISAVVIILGVSISKGKSHHYLFPIYPSLAFLTGIGINYVTSERVRRYIGNVVAVFLVIYVAVLIIFPLKLQSSPKQPFQELFPYIEKYVAPTDTLLLVGGGKWPWEPIFQIIAYSEREATWVSLSDFRKMQVRTDRPILLLDAQQEGDISDKLAGRHLSMQCDKLLFFSELLPEGRFTLIDTTK